MSGLVERMTEEQLYENVRDTAIRFGLMVYHTRDSRRSQEGFPDVVICKPRAGMMMRELKRQGQVPTAAQRIWLDALRSAGVDADVWRPEDWASQRIHNELLALRALRRPA